MLIDVSVKGKKLFEWEGDAAAVARIDEEVNRLAKVNDVTTEALAHTLFDNIVNKGSFFEPNKEAQMMIMIWELISLPTGKPDRPGRCRDYVEAWDFSFDISPGRNGQTFEVNVNGRSSHSLA
jgi:hypothetical protein